MYTHWISGIQTHLKCSLILTSSSLSSASLYSAYRVWLNIQRLQHFLWEQVPYKPILSVKYFSIRHGVITTRDVFFFFFLCTMVQKYCLPNDLGFLTFWDACTHTSISSFIISPLLHWQIRCTGLFVLSCRCGVRVCERIILNMFILWHEHCKCLARQWHEDDGAL